jgi:hypothetical protein
VRKVTARELDVMAITSFGGGCAYSFIVQLEKLRGHAHERRGTLRSKAETYLEKARRISDRHRARFLLVQAHNYLKCAEETEAEQLSAR